MSTTNWADATAKVRRWLESQLGGTVVDLRRQPRWRPVWLADVERDGARLELVVRGDRTDMPLIFPLDHEMRLQQVLWEQGIPTPKVYGLIEDPLAYVMDRVGGQADFRGTSDEERRAAVDDYLQVLARLHALPLEPFLDAGILGPARRSDAGTFGMARYEAVYRATKNGPDPFMEFCLGWLRRNPPNAGGRLAPIVWDSGQFHHADGRILAVLDLEIGHLGDPMMDLAAWRMRDTIVGYGPFDELYARYEELRGEPVDIEALMRHHFAFTLTNQLALGQAVRSPHADTDLMTNMQWCLETNLFASEALGELLDVELPDVEMPDPRRSRGTTALGHMADVLRHLDTDDEWLAYRLRTLFRTSRHALRLDEIGDALSDADLDDLHGLLGHRPDDWWSGEVELERFVLADADEGRFDAELLTVFHARNLRAHMTLGPPGSAMATHLPIQTFR